MTALYTKGRSKKQLLCTKYILDDVNTKWGRRVKVPAGSVPVQVLNRNADPVPVTAPGKPQPPPRYDEMQIVYSSPKYLQVFMKLIHCIMFKSFLFWNVFE